MNRFEVYKLIDTERDHQDILGPERTDGRVHNVGEELILLDVYLRKSFDGGTKYIVWGKKEPRRYCVQCHKKNQKASYARNAEAIRKRRNERYVYKGYNRKWQLKKRYGISIEEYDALLEAQDGVCAICGGGTNGKVDQFCVDHDHESGVVRGLLCNKCNVGLANFKDDNNLLRNAARYLELSNGY
jgi:hypothetical protein